MGNSSSTSSEQEQFEDIVLRDRDFHRALQAIGRPSFEPNDGSLVEWVFRHMYEAEKNSLSLEIDTNAFLHVVSKGPVSQVSVEDHDRHWHCYLELSEYYQKPVSPVVYHTLWHQCPIQELCHSLARKADLEALKIVCYYFPVDRWELLRSLPFALEPMTYQEMVPWRDPDMKERLSKYIDKKYSEIGDVEHVLPLIEVGIEHEPDSLMLAKLKDRYLDLPLEPDNDRPTITGSPRTVSTDAPSMSDDLSISSQREDLQAFDAALLNLVDKLSESQEELLDRRMILSSLQEIQKCSQQEKRSTACVLRFPKKIRSNDSVSILVNSQARIIRDQEKSANAMEENLKQLQYDYDMETTANMARIEYLEDLLNHSDNPSIIPSGSTGEADVSRRAEIRRLAVALELSENRRAEAIEALSRERAQCAHKVQQLISCFQQIKQ